MGRCGHRPLQPNNRFAVGAGAHTRPNGWLSYQRQDVGAASPMPRRQPDNRFAVGAGVHTRPNGWLSHQRQDVGGIPDAPPTTQ